MRKGRLPAVRRRLREIGRIGGWEQPGYTYTRQAPWLTFRDDRFFRDTARRAYIRALAPAGCRRAGAIAPGPAGQRLGEWPGWIHPGAALRPADDLPGHLHRGAAVPADRGSSLGGPPSLRLGRAAPPLGAQRSLAGAAGRR